MTDTELLDYIESKGDDDSFWIARPSLKGRGYRLHEVTAFEAAEWGESYGIKASPTARDAIRDAMNRDASHQGTAP